MIEAVNGWKVRLEASLLDPWKQDVLQARMEFLLASGWRVTKREYRHEELTLVVIMEKEPDVMSRADLEAVLNENL